MAEWEPFAEEEWPAFFSAMCAGGLPEPTEEEGRAEFARWRVRRREDGREEVATVEQIERGFGLGGPAVIG